MYSNVTCTTEGSARMLPFIETRASWLLRVGVPQNFTYNAMRTLVRPDPLSSVQAISTSFTAAEVYLPLPIPTNQTRGIQVGLSASRFNLKTSKSHGDRLASGMSLTHVGISHGYNQITIDRGYILNSRLQAAQAGENI